MSLVSKIVSTLSSQSVASYAQSSAHYDFAIGGLPFLAAAGARLGPYQIADLKRETAPFRKEQVDQSSDVGEQSLSFWWLRSQSSFHAGAGQKFLDGNGDTNPLRVNRFERSRGVDVWTPGQVSLLPAVAQVDPGKNSTAGKYRVVSGGSQTKAVYTTGYHGGVYGLWQVDWNGVFTAVTGHTGTVSGPMVTDGSWVYYTTSTGIWKVSSIGTTATQLYATALGLNLYFLKQRLMATLNNVIYQLDQSASGPTALPTAYYTHPNASLQWLGGGEGPSGMYFASNAAKAGALYFIGITTSTGTPVLNAPANVLTLPAGEQFWGTDQCLGTYLGKFLGLATSLGVRIATINSDGSVTAGPLTLSKDPAAGQFWFGGFAANDRFLYAMALGVDATSQLGSGAEACAFRIDLSLPIDAAGRFAWAQDFCTGDTTFYPESCTWSADSNFYMAGDSSSVCNFYRSCTNKSNPSGPRYQQGAYLTTSRIRYSMGDDKVFERVQVSGEGVAGSLTATATLNGADSASPATAALSGTGLVKAESRIEDSYSAKRGTFLQVRLNVTGTSSDSNDPTMLLRGYVLKALPGQKRQRLMAIPMMCYDNERDTAGNLIGGDATAFGRLRALEALEEAGAPVLYQRFNQAGVAVEQRTVVIDDVLFILRDQPNMQDSWGGIIMCTVRTVD